MSVLEFEKLHLHGLVRNSLTLHMGLYFHCVAVKTVHTVLFYVLLNEQWLERI